MAEDRLPVQVEFEFRFKHGASLIHIGSDHVRFEVDGGQVFVDYKDHGALYVGRGADMTEAILDLIRDRLGIERDVWI